MKKPLLLLVSILTTYFFCQAQSRDLIVKTGEKGLYLDHTVAPKEGLYSIGRLYNVNPKHIASYNKIDFNKGLNIDQVIHIPLTDTNFNQQSAKGTPVYYLVTAGDGLLKISNQHKKVGIKKLKEWNKLPGESVNDGLRLIVGYLSSKEIAAWVKAAPPAEPVKATEPIVAKLDPVQQTAPPPAPKEVVKETPPPVVTVAKETKQEVKEIPKKADPVMTRENNAPAGSPGYFKPYFDQQARLNKESTMSSGIFKTSSGWQDGKYYLLVDGVASGTIVRLVNPLNNKYVYAKVLGQMNGIRQNQGLDIRISNAAASSLGINESDRFMVKLDY